MPCVTVAFNLGRQSWTRDYDVERGSTVWRLKEQMLGPEAGKEDIQSFELQLLGRRVPDLEEICQEQVLDFEYLGPAEGSKRAREDERWTKDEARRGSEEEKAKLARPKVTQAVATPAPRKAKDDKPSNSVPVIKALPPLPKGDHKISVTIDKDMDLQTELTVSGGCCVRDVKEQLQAQDPTGQMDIVGFGLGIASEGEEKPPPLPDTTVLTEKHLRLEITDPYVETDEPHSKVAQYQPAARPKVEPAPPPLPRWEVVGGGDKGGILVRDGVATTSTQLPERLATGAFVTELEIEGERLRYQKLRGKGPETGWVSLSLSGRELLVKREPTVEELFTYDKALDLQEELMWGFAQPEFQATLEAILQEHPDRKGFSFTKKRTQHILSVQSVVLPKYGFEGSPAGVAKMMAAFTQHQSQEILWNGDQLNKLLRME